MVPIPLRPTHTRDTPLPFPYPSSVDPPLLPPRARPLHARTAAGRRSRHHPLRQTTPWCHHSSSPPSPRLSAGRTALPTSPRSSSPHLRPAWLRRPQAPFPRLLPLARHRGRLPPLPRIRSPEATTLTTKPPPLPASFLCGGMSLRTGAQWHSAAPPFPAAASSRPPRRRIVPSSPLCPSLAA
jgi:hypothetical protein